MAAEWGQAKVEMEALRDEILSRIAKGGSARKVYAELRAAGRLIVGQSQFYNHVNRMRAERRAGIEVGALAAHQPAAPAASQPHAGGMPAAAASPKASAESLQTVTAPAAPAPPMARGDLKRFQLPEISNEDIWGDGSADEAESGEAS